MILGREIFSSEPDVRYSGLLGFFFEVGGAWGSILKYHFEQITAFILKDRITAVADKLNIRRILARANYRKKTILKEEGEGNTTKFFY